MSPSGLLLLLISTMFCRAASQLEDGIGTNPHEMLCVNGTLPPDSWNCNNHICPKDQPYSPSYPCIPGYKKEGDDCIDYNECTEKSMCGPFASCKNTAGGYYCICDNGYQKDNKTKFCSSQSRRQKMCTDIDECRDFPGICGSNSICINTPGSYKCICDEGFRKDSNKCVEDVDEILCVNGTLPPDSWNCNKHICPKDQPYSPSYPCIPGYKKYGDDCVDYNECTEKPICGLYASCKNTPGGYYCICDNGYQKDNKTKFCPSQNRRQKMCTDIDECRDFPGICGSNFICINTPGSYKCICDEGFRNVSNKCVDSCPIPPRLAHAELRGDWENESYTPHTVVVYYCQPGYDYFGRIRMICLDGIWQFIGVRQECRTIR